MYAHLSKGNSEKSLEKIALYLTKFVCLFASTLNHRAFSMGLKSLDFFLMRRVSAVGISNLQMEEDVNA